MNRGEESHPHGFGGDRNERQGRLEEGEKTVKTRPSKTLGDVPASYNVPFELSFGCSSSMGSFRGR